MKLRLVLLEGFRQMLARIKRPLTLMCFILALFVGLGGMTNGQTSHGLLIDIDGPISPITANFLDQALIEANESGSDLIVIRINTPGGLLSSTREMVGYLLESEVPSVVYVAPSGARAGSAGTFIAAAANVAVMASGTNIGAASPVGSSGQELSETLANKLTEDAAALMRDVAKKRGRNIEKLESTVTNATSYSSSEAVDLGIVDFVAEDLDDLIAKLDGRTVEIAGDLKTLHTDNISLRQLNLGLVQRFLMVLSDPNIAFLLLSLGGLGLAIELMNPGLIVPGVAGAICLLLAYLVLGTMPVNWVAATFILLGILLVVLEVQVAGFGALGLGGIISLVLGGLLLFHSFDGPSPTMDRVHVSWWLLALVVSTLLLLVGLLVHLMVQSRQKAKTRLEQVMGKLGRVTSPIAVVGVVQMESETWTAITGHRELIKRGEIVEVVGLQGLSLKVIKATKEKEAKWFSGK